MPTVYECPSCGKRLNVPDELVGHHVRCSDCASTFLAEGPPQIPVVGAPREQVEFRPYQGRAPRDDGRFDHRGVLVMCFGIASLGLLILALLLFVMGSAVLIMMLGGLPVCIAGMVLGILAWMFGSDDLRRMRRGAMDPTGQAMTTAGYVCGIIGTVLNTLSLVAACVALVAAMMGLAAFGCCFVRAFSSAMQPQRFPPPPGFKVHAASLELVDYLPRLL